MDPSTPLPSALEVRRANNAYACSVTRRQKMSKALMYFSQMFSKNQSVFNKILGNDTKTCCVNYCYVQVYTVK